MEGKFRKRRRAGGNAVVEVSLLMPWFVFLFMGVFDFGFYAYAMIATENAARAATAYLATSYNLAQKEATSPAPATSLGACQIVLEEMRRLPNISTKVSACGALPVKVQVYQPVKELDGSRSVRLRVTYQTVQLFPIPGLTGLLTINREVQMRIHGV